MNETTPHDPERPQVSTAPRRRAARIARRVAAAVGLAVAGVLFLACGAILFARTDRGRETVRRLAVAEARKTLPGLQIGGIGGDYVHDLILRDVSLLDDRGRPAVRVDRLSARYDVVALLRRTVAVREVRIDGVTVTARSDDRGGLNLAHLTSPARTEQPPVEAPSRPSAWHVHVDRIVVSGANGTAELEDGRAGAVDDLRLDGAMRIDGDRITAVVRQLALAATWEGQAYRASLEGTSFSSSPVELNARIGALRLTGILPGAAPIDLVAAISGPRDRTSIAIAVDAGAAGTARLEGAAGVVPDGAGGNTLGDYDLVLALSEIDPAALRRGAPKGSIGLAVHAKGHGVIPVPGSRATIALDVSPSRVGPVAFMASKIVGTVEDDRWEIPAAVLLRTEGATLSIGGHGRGRAASAALAIDLTGRLRRLAVPGGIAGRGKIEVRAEGTFPDRVKLDARGNVSDLRAASVRLAALRLRADVGTKGDAGQPVRPAGTIKIGAERLQLGAGRPEIASLSLEATGRPDGVISVRGAAAGAHVHGGLRAHGTATAAAADVSLDALSVDVTTTAYRQKLDLERPARIRYRAGEEVAVDHVALRGAGARFTGEALLDATYRLPPARREPLAEAALDLRQASVGGLTPVDARMTARLDRRRANVVVDAKMPAAAAELHLDADLPVETRSGAPKLAAHGRTSVHLKTNKVRVQAIPFLERTLARQGITGGTASIDLTVDGDIAHPNARGAFDVREVMYRNIAGLGRDSTLKTVPGLGGSLAIDTRPGNMKASARLLIRNTGVLDAELQTSADLGDIIKGADLAALPIHASVRIPRFRLASLADFSDGFDGVQGDLLGQAELSGTARRPSGRADFTVEGAQVDKVKFQQVKLHAEGDKGRLSADLALQQTTGGRLDGSVTVERSREDRLRAWLKGKDLDVGFARIFLTNVRELSGVAQLSMSANGTVQAPEVRASLSLEKGRIGVTGQPTFGDLRLNASLAPGRADLHRLEARSGGGSLQGKGWALLGGPGGLSPRSAVFTAHAHRFLVAAAGTTGARIDGDLAVNAALREDILSGKVEIPDANVWLPKGAPTGGGRNLQKIGAHADVHFVDQTAVAAAQRDREKRKQKAAEALKLAIEARAKPVYIRGKDLDLEVRSDIRIGSVASGPHAGAPTLSGGIHIPRGRINVQGQRFDFERGNITFNGSSEIEPELDLKLTHQYPEALVIIELRGTPKKPELRMSSDPPVYDQAQIVSLILTGQPGGQPSTGKSFDPTAAVATAVLSKLADKVAPALGLDVLRVESQEIKNDKDEATGDKDTRVEVGKYVTERIYLSYAHIFGAPDNANQNEAHVEYRMTRRLMMETVFGDAGQGALDTVWTYRF